MGLSVFDSPLLMKKILSLFVALTIILSLCACQGNYGSVNLNDPVAIGEDGVIAKNIIEQIRSQNAIGVFTGEADGVRYEWTIFGSDIDRVQDVNLRVAVEKAAEGELWVVLSQEGDFGFSALLSLYLSEQWNVRGATAYRGDQPIASVSVTGSKNTILNVTLDGTVGEILIRGEEIPEETVAVTASTEGTASGSDAYLSKPTGTDENVYTGGKDKYNTDPVPPGKPQPVEPENQEVDKGTVYTCTFSIECSTILNNLDMLDPEKLEMVPSSGVILSTTTVTFCEGESVIDVLQRLCKEKGIHMEASWTPIYNSAYIEGIHNLYEFDCGSLSGWMYEVNGWYPNYGSSRYQLKDGDVVEWRYTCDLGNDIGGGYAVGG